ncbi:hypothetical protein [Paraburkholderia kururiensis]
MSAAPNPAYALANRSKGVSGRGLQDPGGVSRTYDMNDRFLLPVALRGHECGPGDADGQDETQFLGKQVELICLLLRRAHHLRGCGRETPVADLIVSCIVNLLEALELNSPDETEIGLARLQQIIDLAFTGGPWKAASG